MRILFAVCGMLIALGFASCGTAETPLDAIARGTVDSIATVEIRQLRIELDSQCKQAQVTVLPHLVDSIRQIRLQEINEQLKTVPK